MTQQPGGHNGRKQKERGVSPRAGGAGGWVYLGGRTLTRASRWRGKANRGGSQLRKSSKCPEPQIQGRHGINPCINRRVPTTTSATNRGQVLCTRTHVLPCGAARAHTFTRVCQTAFDAHAHHPQGSMCWIFKVCGGPRA